jgi:hypothetical protein
MVHPSIIRIEVFCRLIGGSLLKGPGVPTVLLIERMNSSFHLPRSERRFSLRRI